ncbi:MAG TPA: nucleoside-triphosphatase [Candidatus Limnocylindria bacterium]|nr:nucleoside-triphosphatase [Candidatus Limnocylindria bacterium]
MIILLTGKPGIGKSTVIEKLIQLNKKPEEPATWVVTAGIPRPEGGRAGFSATNSAGVTRTISHKTDIPSDVIIGENHVDLVAVDAMFAQALEGATKPGALTILDEIGPIQLLSPAFTAALEEVFTGDPDLIATIHYKDEQLATYRTAARAVLLEVTLDNRDTLPEVLAALIINRKKINKLSMHQKAAFFELLQRYANEAKLLQVQKLMDNALKYIHEDRVLQDGPDHWIVGGRHGQYHVTLQGDAYACECRLFNGTGPYTGQPGECSHIQAVSIWASKLER